MAWILAIATIPVLGLTAYILAGIDRRKRKLVNKIPEDLFSSHLTPLLEDQKLLIDRLLQSVDPKDRRAARNIHLLAKATAAPVTGDNSVTTYYRGEDKFQALIEDIKSAKKTIHMEYYLWCSDQIGDRILNLLVEKAEAGIAIRLIFDGWGSFGKISFAYRRALRTAGIEFAYFLDLTNPIARIKINYRNHRKIAVIDGRVAYVGGMNVADNYINGGRKFSTWRDTHLRIEGSAVTTLQAVFLVDWHNSGGELLLQKSMFPTTNQASGEIPIQIAISGPDSRWEGIRLHYLELLNGAREEVLIQTPYYIPGEAIEQAMIAAALRGVRVVLMPIGLPDKWIPYWAAQTYFTPLLEAGVEIFRYQAGFLHSKVFIQDRYIASVGTGNVDLRSFYLDYEVNAVIYSPEEAESQADQFLRDLNKSTPVTLADMEKISQFGRLRNAAVRLLSPLM